MLYLAITLFGLGRYPIVGQDEPWIAAPAYKLASEGILGSDLFAGYHGMERHHFVHMPVYAVIEAAVFRAAGVGVVQMRVLSVLFGLVLLLLAHAVGPKVGGVRVASLAVVLMVVHRLTLPTLIDAHARELFADTANPAHPYHHIATGFEAFRASRPLNRLCEIQDHSYGTMEVYRVGGSGQKPSP